MGAGKGVEVGWDIFAARFHEPRQLGQSQSSCFSVLVAYRVTIGPGCLGEVDNVCLSSPVSKAFWKFPRQGEKSEFSSKND